MTTAKALLRNHRQSPRKVRLVADLVRGKSVERALSNLTFLQKKASHTIKKLIESGVANAKDQDLNVNDLVVSSITVDDGLTLYRRRPRAQGNATPIRKRTSHIALVLEERNNNSEKASQA